MKKNLLSVGLACIVLIAFYPSIEKFVWQQKQADFTAYLKKHPFNNRQVINKKEWKNIAKKDRPDLAMEREYLLTMDPELKRPTPERLIPVIMEVNELRKLAENKTLPGSNGYEWNERGPNNVGGRTRAIMFDPNDANNKKVWAGGVGGGMWFTTDITNNSVAWQNVNDFWSNIAISCIAYDPGNTNVFYAGTGEGWYNSDAQRGGGLWKTSDGGSTWSVLSATTGNNFSFIQDVLVHPTTSDVYVATRNGLYRSTNGGTTFSQVLSGVMGDLEIGADNDLYVTKGNVFTAGNLYRSTSGNSGTWSSLNGSGFPTSGIGRVELATAPSNANVLYALTQDLSTYDVGGIYKSTNKGASWTTLTMPTWSEGGNFARGQAWYDLIAGVDPTNENVVYVGGVDLFKTTNGGSSWTQLTNWWRDPAETKYAHADQHAIVFKPDNNNFVVFGNDGGVSITTNAGSSFSTRINGYNVTQFYSCAISPGAGTFSILGGAQDNGSHLITASGIQSSTELLGGDGAFAFIDQVVDDIMIVSSQNGNFYKYQGGSYAGKIIDGSTGSFINPADYDDRENILYSAINNSTNSINRIINIDGTPNIQTISTNLNAELTHLRVSPYASNGTTNLFVGTNAGGVYKISNAHDGSATTTNISIPENGAISCIEIGVDENELLVTLSNYGVTSVYYSSNGGSSWVSKEGNLPDMPIRWALFNPNDRKEVLLATEVGVWGTYDLSVSIPTWTPHVLGMANARVDMLQVRESDLEVIAGTHGRGFYTSSGFNDNTPPALEAMFTANSVNVTAGQGVTFEDNSTGSPETWAWVFTGGSPASHNGQTPPSITYDSPGCYEVQLTVTRNAGSESDIEIKTCYITVSEAQECFTLFSYDVDTDYFIHPRDSANFNLQFVDNDGLTVHANLANNGWTSGWNILNNDGNQQLAATSWFEPAAQASNWIILGPVTTPDISALLTWKHVMSDNNYRDGYEVLITTTGSNISNFSDPEASSLLSFTDNDAATNNDTLLVEQSIALPGSYLSKEVYIAFHHNANDQFILSYDDFQLEGCASVNKPVVNFEANQTLIPTGSVVDFTDLSQEIISAWNWDFDGGIGSSNVQHPKGVQFNDEKCYDIKLVASNAAGTDSLVKTCYVEAVNVPVADFTASTKHILVGGSVDFTDASSNSPDAWTWSFEGAETTNSSMQNPSGIVYNTPGCYEVSLIASKKGLSSGEESKSCFINVYEAPQADFVASSTVVGVGESVDFTDLSTGDVDNWSWTFQGSVQETSSMANPSGITYNVAGVYEVSLEVSIQGMANDIITKTGYIEVIELPIANFVASDSTIFANDTIDFTNLSAGELDSSYWTFDGANILNSLDINPSEVVYPTQGCYEVTLQVFYKGLEGVSKTKTCYIEVESTDNVLENEENLVRIFPNPVKDMVVIQTSQQIQKFEIYNTTGQLILEGILNSVNPLIDVNDLQSGSYYLRLMGANKESMHRLVKTM